MPVPAAARISCLGSRRRSKVDEPASRGFTDTRLSAGMAGRGLNGSFKRRDRVTSDVFEADAAGHEDPLGGLQRASPK